MAAELALKHVKSKAYWGQTLRLRLPLILDTKAKMPHSKHHER